MKPASVTDDYPARERLTTVRTGGHADHYARPDTAEALEELLAWAERGRDRGRSGRLRIEPPRSG